MANDIKYELHAHTPSTGIYILGSQKFYQLHTLFIQKQLYSRHRSDNNKIRRNHKIRDKYKIEGHKT